MALSEKAKAFLYANRDFIVFSVRDIQGYMKLMEKVKQESLEDWQKLMDMKRVISDSFGSQSEYNNVLKSFAASTAGSKQYHEFFKYIDANEEAKNFFITRKMNELNPILDKAFPNISKEEKKIHHFKIDELKAHIKKLQGEIESLKGKREHLVVNQKMHEENADAFKNVNKEKTRNALMDQLIVIKKNLENLDRSPKQNEIHSLFKEGDQLSLHTQLEIADKALALPPTHSPTLGQRVLNAITKPFALLLNKLGIGKGQGMYGQTISNFEITQASKEIKSIAGLDAIKEKYSALYDSMTATSQIEKIDKLINKNTEQIEKDKAKIGQWEKSLLFHEKPDIQEEAQPKMKF